MDPIDDLDACVDNYYTASWKSSLIFSACVVCPQSKSYEDVRNAAGDVDIFQFTSTSELKALCKKSVVRFDPEEYKLDDKVDDKFGRDTDGSLACLCRTVQRSRKTVSLNEIYVVTGTNCIKNRALQRVIHQMKLSHAT